MHIYCICYAFFFILNAYFEHIYDYFMHVICIFAVLKCMYWRLFKPGWRLRMAAEAAHGGRSRPCMAVEAAATIRAPESSFPSARRPPPLRRMLPLPTGHWPIMSLYCWMIHETICSPKCSCITISAPSRVLVSAFSAFLASLYSLETSS